MADAPTDLVKAEFGRRIQRLMVEKGWSQAELAREATRHMPAKKKFRRDNVSNYVRGRQMPNPMRMKALCDALGVDSKEIIPVGAVRSVDSASPPLEMRPVDGGNVFLRINQVMSQETALEILSLIRKAT